MKTLLQLKDSMSNCTACDLCKNRNSVVFGEGSDNPQIMIIGEAPGEEEDLKGIPFVGKAGNKLDNILRYVGLDRKNVYITNSVLCRPLNNRNPTFEELQSCRQRLLDQIDILKPEVIIALGKIAVEQLKGKTVKGPLKQFFTNNWWIYNISKHKCLLLVTYHPSYLIRSPEKAYKAVLPHWNKIKEWLTNEQA